MIIIHREYQLANSPDLHAHIDVNPIGLLNVEIVELKEHHTTEFDDLSFEISGTETRIKGKEDAHAWQFKLTSKDAFDLSAVIEDANEEYETLMRDLM